MMFTKKNIPPKLQRTLDGVRKEKDSLLTNPDGPLRKSLAQTEKMDRHVADSSRNRKMRHFDRRVSEEQRNLSETSIWLSKILSQKRMIAGGIATLILIVGVSTYFSEEIKGATYGWTQSNWSGGQTANTANHTNNQENWTEFASKDANIDTTSTPGEVKIVGTSNSWIQTSDGDFNAMSKNKLYVSGTGTNADVKLLKPFGATCSTNAECFDGNITNSGSWCNAGICTNPWISGPCAGIYTYYKDSSTGSQWKTSDTACDTPQCGINGGQSNDNLVADNSIDFSLYPARNICKNIGGRLPTISELQCIYTNRAVYDDYGAFVANGYWSSAEYSTTTAYYVAFYNGDTYSGHGKTSSYYTRCVRGQ